MHDKVGQCSVGEYLARRLEQAGLRHYFTVPGDFNLVLLDQLSKNPRLLQRAERGLCRRGLRTIERGRGVRADFLTALAEKVPPNQASLAEFTRAREDTTPLASVPHALDPSTTTARGWAGTPRPSLSWIRRWTEPWPTTARA